jgi:NADPH-dependent 7-cyano-7-deazaguanine reductase QueF
MINQYETEITCMCPVDNLPDVYHLTVTARRVIPVENIIAAVAEFREQKLYQEDLCQAIHRKINACCVLVGSHSGVRVRSQCGEA